MANTPDVPGSGFERPYPYPGVIISFMANLKQQRHCCPQSPSLSGALSGLVALKKGLLALQLVSAVFHLLIRDTLSLSVESARGNVQACSILSKAENHPFSSYRPVCDSRMDDSIDLDGTKAS
jgi:hypothetical protein